MRKILLPIVLIIVAASIYFFAFKKDEKKPDPPKQQPVAVSKYSTAFNTSVQKALNDYYALSEAFVNWDSAAIHHSGQALQNSLHAIAFGELKKDTVIQQTAMSYLENFKTDLQTIIDQPDIAVKRQSFNSFSQNFYDLLRTIRYDGSTIYMQQCPMAFNDSEPGTWLSGSSTIRNPYLGLHHPKYKSGMIECGETKDSLRFGK